jgi:hypothetical protein
MLSYSLELFSESLDIAKNFLCYVINYHHIFKVNIWIYKNFYTLLVLIPYILIFFWSKKGFIISDDTFLNLALHISSIDISLNIMSLSKERICDNVTYMLCMLIGMLSCGCFKSMIKWSNDQMFVLEI